jgi:hypothetical protein
LEKKYKDKITSRFQSRGKKEREEEEEEKERRKTQRPFHETLAHTFSCRPDEHGPIYQI